MKRRINRIRLFSNHNEKAKMIEEQMKNQLEEKEFLVVEKDYDMGLCYWWRWFLSKNGKAN